MKHILKILCITRPSFYSSLKLGEERDGENTNYDFQNFDDLFMICTSRVIFFHDFCIVHESIF